MEKKKRKKEVIRLERESVISVLKAVLVTQLASLLGDPSEQNEFERLCKRVEYTIRAWYTVHFEDMMLKYSIFDPVIGADNLKQYKVTPEQADKSEMIFLKYLFQLDKRLLKKFFKENHHENLPDNADKGYGACRLEEFFGQFKNTRDPKKDDKIRSQDDPDDLYVERFHLENMELSVAHFLSKITIKEPTFNRIIVVYRPASTKEEPDRTIYLKHFKHIPMADMEIPEKKIPGLTPTDWVKFLGSAVVGLVTVISSLQMAEPDLWVIFAILSTVIGYCASTYFTFQENFAAYQNLITQSMYDKQLDSGRGTLLHLCDDMIQQEVKEVIISFYLLMTQGKATLRELDLRCEKLLKDVFKESCNFDVDDAVQKLEKLGIVSLVRPQLDLRCEKLLKDVFKESCNFDVDDAVQKLEKLGIVSLDSEGYYSCVDLKSANEIIGTTTEERVLQARQGSIKDEAALEKWASFPLDQY